MGGVCFSTVYYMIEMQPMFGWSCGRDVLASISGNRLGDWGIQTYRTLREPVSWWAYFDVNSYVACDGTEFITGYIYYSQC